MRRGHEAMSQALALAVINRSPVLGAAYKVHLVLAVLANGAGVVPLMSMRELAEYARMDRRTMARALARLERAAELDILRAHPAINRYRVTIAPEPAAAIQGVSCG